MNILTREEHITWCKERALEYVDAGDVHNAWVSLVSDLNKHPETEGHQGIELGLMMLASGNLSTPSEMQKFIVGFN